MLRERHRAARSLRAGLVCLGVEARGLGQPVLALGVEVDDAPLGAHAPGDDAPAHDQSRPTTMRPMP